MYKIYCTQVIIFDFYTMVQIYIYYIDIKTCELWKFIQIYIINSIFMNYCLYMILSYVYSLFWYEKYKNISWKIQCFSNFWRYFLYLKWSVLMSKTIDLQRKLMSKITLFFLKIIRKIRMLWFYFLKNSYLCFMEFTVLQILKTMSLVDS